jgi:hypothetical protein
LDWAWGKEAQFRSDVVPQVSLDDSTVHSGAYFSRQIQAEQERETQQLQQCWVELRHGVRSIYRNAGTKKTDDQDLISKVDIEKMKDF